MNNLYNLSPIDSRYQEITKDLEEYLSEYALIKYRVFTEIKWLIFLIDKKVINFPSKKEIKKIEEIYEKFTIDEAVKVKEKEKTTKHDVKAIEYYLRDKFNELKEELGLDFNEKDANFYRTLRDDYAKDFKDIWVFRKDVNIKDLSFTDGEVEESKWVTIDEFEKMIKRKEIIPTIDFTKEDYKKCLEWST